MGAILLIAVAVLVVILWGLIRFTFRIPSLVSGASRARRRRSGLAALSRGMVAIGAGDSGAAQRHSVEAERLLKREPMVLLLRAQAAQLSGNQDQAEATFAEMLNLPETRALGLRGLHIEAQRRGDPEARLCLCRRSAPVRNAALGRRSLCWPIGHPQRGDWAGALTAVERNAGGRLIDRPVANRQRAVLNTALGVRDRRTRSRRSLEPPARCPESRADLGAGRDPCGPVTDPQGRHSPCRQTHRDSLCGDPSSGSGRCLCGGPAGGCGGRSSRACGNPCPDRAAGIPKA